MTDYITQLSQVACNSVILEYQDLTDTFNSFDSKAGSTVKMGGIFLAANLAFANAISGDDIGIRLLLSSSLALVLVSIVLCLGVVTLRKITAPPPGNQIARTVNHLVKLGDNLDGEDLIAFTQRRTRLWQTTNDDITRANKIKGILLTWSQGILVVASLIASVAFSLFIWS